MPRLLDFVYEKIIRITKLTLFGAIMAFTLAVFILWVPSIARALFFFQSSGGIMMVTSLNGGHGTGFHVTNSKGERYLVTNAHVCGANSTFMIVGPDGANHFSRVIRKSTAADVCILTPVGNYKSFKLKPSKTLYYELPLHVIGYPRNYPMTYSSGNVIGFTTRSTFRSNVSVDECKDGNGRHFQVNSHSTEDESSVKTTKEWCEYEITSIQTNISIRTGNSGSPLLDFFGNVRGMIWGADSGYWGIAVTSEDIIKLIEE